MYLRTESNGRSASRGKRFDNSPECRPACSAASSSARSVGVPRALPPSATASLHSSIASSIFSRSPVISSTRISPSVIVPVLSVQITETDPSVSAAIRRRVSALWRDMRRIPIASTIVTEIPSPSGIAATASATDVWNISSDPRPNRTPTPNIRTTRTMTATDSHFARRFSSICSGVSRSSVSATSRAIPPSSVRAPVATTTPTPRPATTDVPANSMFDRSAIAAPGMSGPVPFAIDADSPVSDASFASHATLSITRMSAAILSPAVTTTMSPATISSAGIVASIPSRRTTTVARTSDRSRSIALFA